MLKDGALFAERFTVVRTVATGGFGTVYEVTAPNGRHRALKVLLPHLSIDPSVRERFEFEATIGARIESDHIVEVFEMGEVDGTPWLLMEMLSGETLEDRVSREALDVAETADLFEQIGHGLGAAHRAGVLHMDLKPANLFLAEPRLSGAPVVLKILDFGIARRVEAGKSSAELTSAGGTLAWEAPEQTDAGEHVHPSIDVWPLGLIAFYALTGREYWRVQNATKAQYNAKALLKEILFEALVPASARAAALDPSLVLPEGFDAWFSLCLDRDPSGRFQNAEEAIGPLLEILDSALPDFVPSMSPPLRHQSPLPSPPSKPSDPARALRSNPTKTSSDTTLSLRSNPTKTSSDALRALRTNPTKTPTDANRALRSVPAKTPTDSRLSPRSERSESKRSLRGDSKRSLRPAPPRGPRSGLPLGPRSTPPPPLPPPSPEPLPSIPAPAPSPAPSPGPAPNPAPTSAPTGRTETPTPSSPLTRPPTPPTGMSPVLTAGAVLTLLLVALKGLPSLRRNSTASDPHIGSHETTPPRHVPCAVALGVWPSGVSCREGMVRVPGGVFLMGSVGGVGNPDEHPQRCVTVRPFCLDRTEVSVSAFREYWLAEHPTPGAVPGYPEGERRWQPAWQPAWGVSEPTLRSSDNPTCTWNSLSSSLEGNPINCVDWFTSQAFCGFKGGRLPTETEWEFAARGTDRREFPWGNESPTSSLLNACGQECLQTRSEAHTMPGLTDDGFSETAPVTAFGRVPSRFGAINLAGNVYEWTADWYAAQPEAPGAGERNRRVLRGGAWFNLDVAAVRAADRGWAPPTAKNSYLGFRCARSALP